VAESLRKGIAIERSSDELADFEVLGRSTSANLIHIRNSAGQEVDLLVARLTAIG
jgi:hypothetical protein